MQSRLDDKTKKNKLTEKEHTKQLPKTEIGEAAQNMAIVWGTNGGNY